MCLRCVAVRRGLAIRARGASVSGTFLYLIAILNVVVLVSILHPPTYEIAMRGSLIYFAIGAVCSYAFFRIGRKSRSVPPTTPSFRIP